MKPIEEYIENKCSKCNTKIKNIKQAYCSKCNERIILCQLCGTKIAKYTCIECNKQFCYYCGENNLCDECINK